ncbi:transcription factor bHLH93-like isoform X2 [Telopea speciosissima]|uniref:transcription factor bHLH93-like isoform X2 n=1 Tax=Telopea speciosissima TaxID=54955 RepID=UPI001CC5F554|nr:transcription factor bHLH93-like isoform X2 [Telopea speciosissima]
MELNEQGFLEELLALKRETWERLPATGTGMNELFTNGCSLNCFDDQNPGMIGPNSSPCGGFAMSTEPSFDSSFNYETYYPFGDGFPQLLPDMGLSSYEKQEYDTMPFPASQEECPSAVMENEELRELEELQTSCKVELPVQPNMGLCVERKNRTKKVEGQPSKNLMAERRRRKRLNDRLSMLRSVVPKISKMDRTSILGDTIDYMKELLERIKGLQGEIEESSTDQLNLMDTFKELKSNEVLVRNTPKFDVERRNADTRVEICCAGKPGLLLSTVTTLEALGLEIQQCVISCFNDFSMNASCSGEMEQRAIISSEDIKQALFRNAGYGGRCL